MWILRPTFWFIACWALVFERNAPRLSRRITTVSLGGDQQQRITTKIMRMMMFSLKSSLVLILFQKEMCCCDDDDDDDDWCCTCFDFYRISQLKERKKLKVVFKVLICISLSHLDSIKYWREKAVLTRRFFPLLSIADVAFFPRGPSGCNFHIQHLDECYT